MPLLQADPRIEALVRSYHQRAGIPYLHQPLQVKPAEVPVSRAIASWYDNAKHDPSDPAVAASYRAFKNETEAQYQHLVNSGFKFEPYPDGEEPYSNPDGTLNYDKMRQDALRGHLWYFTGGDMPKDHPLSEHSRLEPSMTFNEMFRAVHDVFGHARYGNDFTHAGENAAWVSHGRMYSELAKPAMSAETRGQNSWVWHGPHESKSTADKPYAEQKATAMPAELMKLKRRPLRFAAGVDNVNPYGPGQQAAHALDLDPLNWSAHSQMGDYLSGRKHPDAGFHNMVAQQRPAPYVNPAGHFDPPTTGLTVGQLHPAIAKHLPQTKFTDPGHFMDSLKLAWKKAVGQRGVNRLRRAGQVNRLDRVVSSSNTEQDLDFETANQLLRSPQHASYKRVSSNILQTLGIPHTQHDAIGDWVDGAEHSVIHTIPDPVDPSKVRYAASWIGLLANQKAVLHIKEVPNGPDSLYEVSLPETDPKKIRESLDQSGIPFRTIVPHKDSTSVIVYDKGRKWRPQMEQFARLNNAAVRESSVIGEFIGDSHDPPTRTAARAEYRRIIEQYESGQHVTPSQQSGSSAPAAGGGPTAAQPLSQAAQQGPNVPNAGPSNQSTPAGPNRLGRTGRVVKLAAGATNGFVPGRLKTKSPPAGHLKSPPGGCVFRGLYYPGGKFIPSAEFAKGTPQEKEQLYRHVKRSIVGRAKQYARGNPPRLWMQMPDVLKDTRVGNLLNRLASDPNEDHHVQALAHMVLEGNWEALGVLHDRLQETASENNRPWPGGGWGKQGVYGIDWTKLQQNLPLDEKTYEFLNRPRPAVVYTSYMSPSGVNVVANLSGRRSIQNGSFHDTLKGKYKSHEIDDSLLRIASHDSWSRLPHRTQPNWEQAESSGATRHMPGYRDLVTAWIRKLRPAIRPEDVPTYIRYSIGPQMPESSHTDPVYRRMAADIKQRHGKDIPTYLLYAMTYALANVDSIPSNLSNWHKEMSEPTGQDYELHTTPHHNTGLPPSRSEFGQDDTNPGPNR